MLFLRCVVWGKGGGLFGTNASSRPLWPCCTHVCCWRRRHAAQCTHSRVATVPCMYPAALLAGQGAVAHQVGSTHVGGHRWGRGVCQAAADIPLLRRVACPHRSFHPPAPVSHCSGQLCADKLADWGPRQEHEPVGADAAAVHAGAGCMCRVQLQVRQYRHQRWCPRGSPWGSSSWQITLHLPLPLPAPRVPAGAAR